MSEQTNVAFPIAPKKKLRIVIRDNFEDVENDSTEFLLSQLDATEKNEQDIVRAVSSANNESIPVPEVKRIPEISAEFLKSGAVFDAPERCYNYDSDYFDPLKYFADETDMKWVDDFNKTHKFLKVSIRDVEIVFEKIESIVKDYIIEEPKLSQILHLIPEPAPPYSVISAIYDHWLTREKQNGSIIKYREFPPDHCLLRNVTTTQNRTLFKVRKALNDGEYMKRLFKELKDIQNERAKALETLRKQEERQREDQRMLREEMRKIKKIIGQNSCLVQEPKPMKKRTFDETVNQPNLLLESTIPQPPTKPSFLNWCMKQQLSNSTEETNNFLNSSLNNSINVSMNNENFGNMSSVNDNMNGNFGGSTNDGMNGGNIDDNNNV
ncbi:hypothetical protein TRFO_26241 [Tritrichomonas foetus]|uniref:Enhancer of polycomb-like protein n=1 Tax=Tritrichomonas foetus TaxID=1144522 RepID=A0A1J4K3W8_9EUKA|nr:hypothetical protein TRFO_26241 [Tritrichomonas foetus]|eukprot:OHT05883.1 hypothetical protein TRFO_26241 [Tritrichomonas foetus]